MVLIVTSHRRRVLVGSNCRSSSRRKDERSSPIEGKRVGRAGHLLCNASIPQRLAGQSSAEGAQRPPFPYLLKGLDLLDGGLGQREGLVALLYGRVGKKMDAIAAIFAMTTHPLLTPLSIARSGRGM